MRATVRGEIVGFAQAALDLSTSWAGAANAYVMVHPSWPRSAKPDRSPSSPSWPRPSSTNPEHRHSAYAPRPGSGQVRQIHRPAPGGCVGRTVGVRGQRRNLPTHDRHQWMARLPALRDAVALRESAV